MYFWNSYPFVRLSLAFIGGIILFDHISILWISPTLTSIAFFLILSISIWISNRHSYFRFRHINGTLTLVLVIYLGGWITKIHYHELSPKHYSNIEGKIQGYEGIIASPVNERTNHFRYDLELIHVITDSVHTTTGKIHIYIKKDSSFNPLKYGDHIVVKGAYYPIPHPGNPSEFNYKKYLQRQSIHAHSFVRITDLNIIEHKASNKVLSYAYYLRDEAIKIINNNISFNRENAIAKALILGIKDHLDNDIKRAYSSAGAMHVLAVSGLHVGIIYLIISTIFGRLSNYGKTGKWIFGLINIILIWIYALTTGMSPSVLRAATMFSLIAIGQVNGRQGNIYNTLGVAAFILLIYDPYFIYSVGFQLSFAAVIGIVYLHPLLYRRIEFHSWILDKSWSITCVSIAAQVATFPLTAYYFHQFPTYFLASNLIVIPAAFLMLIFGISMLLIDPISHVLAQFFGQLLSHFMFYVNESIVYIEKLPYSLITWIHLDFIGLVLTYMIIIVLVHSFHFRIFGSLVTSFMLGFIFIGWNITTYANQANKNQLTFYEINSKTAIDHIDGLHSQLYVDASQEEEIELLSFQIDPHRLSSRLNPISSDLKDIDDLFHKRMSIKMASLSNQKIILLDTTTFHIKITEPIDSDIILIENEAVKNLSWLKEKFHFRQLIIGNRNSRFYCNKMTRQAKENNLKIHIIPLDGAITLNLE